MKRRAFLAAACSAAAAAGCGIPFFGGFRPFTFVQIADPQFGFSAGGDGNNFAVEADVLTNVVAAVNRMLPAPAFVAVCGDLTHNAGHTAQLAAYRRIIAGVDRSIPVHTIPGNHDFKSDLAAETIEAYRKLFGPDRYAFEVQGWRFLALNSVLFQTPVKRPDELDSQTAWLRKTLAEARTSRSRGIVAFMHHPFTDDDLAAGASTPARACLDILAEYRVAAVFSGHTHRTIPEKNHRGVRLINTNGLVRSFDDNPGLRIATVLADRVENRFVSVRPGAEIDLMKPAEKAESRGVRFVA